MDRSEREALDNWITRTPEEAGCYGDCDCEDCSPVDDSAYRWDCDVCGNGTNNPVAVTNHEGTVETRCERCAHIR